MFFLTVLLAFSQNGLQNMVMANASSCGNTICIEDVQSIILIRTNATNMAKSMIANEDLIKIASESFDMTHRVSAAFAYGMKKQVHENLYKLLEDSNDIVSQASREAFVYIAAYKYNKKNVDFGPFTNGAIKFKHDASNMWRVFFEDKKLAIGLPTQKKKLHLADIYNDEMPNKKLAPLQLENQQKNDNKQDDEPLPTDKFDPDWLTVKANQVRRK